MQGLWEIWILYIFTPSALNTAAWSMATSKFDAVITPVALGKGPYSAVT